MAKASKPGKPNISGILDQAPSAFERPPALPAGSYSAQIKGLPREDKSSVKKTDYVEFTFKLTGAGDDVDPDDLKAVGGLADKEMKLTFYLTDKSTYRLREFMNDDLGIEDMESLRAMIEETPGKEFIVYLNQKSTDDGKGFYNDIAKTAPAE